MKQFRIFAVAALFAFAASALAQTGTDDLQVTGTVPGPTVSVLITDTSGGDFGGAYAINSGGSLNVGSYAWGADFLVRVTYSNVTTDLSLAIAGSQANYDLAWRYMDGTGAYTANKAFGTVGTAAVSNGSATDTFLAGPTGTAAFTTFSTDNLNGSKLSIGASAQSTAVANLNATVTLTATVN